MDSQPAEVTMPSYGDEPAGMSMSAAMDVLDEFHIKRSDYARVMQALEAVYGDKDEPEAMPDADNATAEPDDDEAMAKDIFASDRNRRG